MEEALQFHQLIMIFLQVMKLSEILQISLVNVCDLIMEILDLKIKFIYLFKLYKLI